MKLLAKLKNLTSRGIAWERTFVKASTTYLVQNLWAAPFVENHQHCFSNEFFNSINEEIRNLELWISPEIVEYILDIVEIFTNKAYNGGKNIKDSIALVLKELEKEFIFDEPLKPGIESLVKRAYSEKIPDALFV